MELNIKTMLDRSTVRSKSSTERARHYLPLIDWLDLRTCHTVVLHATATELRAVVIEIASLATVNFEP